MCVNNFWSIEGVNFLSALDETFVAAVKLHNRDYLWCFTVVNRVNLAQEVTSVIFLCVQINDFFLSVEMRFQIVSGKPCSM